MKTYERLCSTKKNGSSSIMTSALQYPRQDCKITAKKNFFLSNKNHLHLPTCNIDASIPKNGYKLKPEEALTFYLLLDKKRHSCVK